MPVDDLSKLTDEQLEAYRSLRSGSPQGQPQEQPAPPGFLSSLGNTVKSFWNTVQGPRDIGNGLIDAGRHLLDRDPNTNTLNRMGNQTIDLGRSAFQDLRRGNVLGGARKALNTGINALVPGLGKSSEEAGEAFDRGDYAEGAGRTLGVGTNAAAMALAPRVLPPVARGAAETITPGVSGPLGRLTEVNPRVAVNRALRPVPSDPTFPQNMPETLSSIKEANPGFRPDFNGEDFNLSPAIGRTIDRTQAALDPWMARAKGRTIAGDQIVDATRQSIPKLMWTKDPAGAQELVTEAQRTWGGKQFSPDDFRDFLKTGNAGLAKFYKQAPAAQQGAAVAGSPPAIGEAEIAGIRRALYEALDPEGGGAGPRLIQGRTGNLIDMRDAAARRSNAILAEQPLTPLGKMIDPLRGALHGLLPWRTGTGLAYAEGSAGRSLPWLRKGFDAVGDTTNALPQPGTPFYPTGHPTRLLTEGDRITPPPADTSFVRGASAMGQPPTSTRALPMGRPTLFTEPPADTSYVRGVGLAPHERVNAERPMLPAGSAPFTQGTVVPDILGRPGQTTHRLIERPTQPEIPTGHGVHEVSPVDTSEVRSLPAASQTVRDPATGRMKRIYTSQPK